MRINRKNIEHDVLLRWFKMKDYRPQLTIAEEFRMLFDLWDNRNKIQQLIDEEVKKIIDSTTDG